MSEKILTVSIAAYNVEKYIEECLNHFTILPIEILKKLEVFIIDDGGVDNTREIANKYVGQYPNTFRFVHKENGGWGSTVNKGIELATGKYFKQLDGDDHYNSETLADFIETLEKVNTDIVYSPYLEFQDKKNKVDLVGYWHTGKIRKTVELAELYNMVESCSMHAFAFKTTLLKKYKIRLLEQCFYTDAELYVKAFVYAEKIYAYPNYVYCYRLGRDGQSVSVDGLRKHYKDNEKVIDELLAYINKVDLSIDKKKVIRANILKCIEFQYISLIKLNKIDEVRKFDKKIVYQYGMDVDKLSDVVRKCRNNDFENAFNILKSNEQIVAVKSFFKHNVLTGYAYKIIRKIMHNIHA